MDISLADGIGHLTQWDIGRTMQVSGVEGPYMVHFYTSRLSRALVVQPQADGTVAVPNLVLQSSAPLMVAVFRQDGPDEPGKTILIKEFCIRAKAKPEDYSYVENIGYINWVEKKAELEAYMQELIRLRNSGAFDGVSPAVTVEKRADGHIVTITDRTGPHTFFVADGQSYAVELDPTLTDATKAAQAKATGDIIRTVLDTAIGKQDKIQPTGITPGQLIRAKTIVDGDVTEWEPVDYPPYAAQGVTGLVTINDFFGVSEYTPSGQRKGYIGIKPATAADIANRANYRPIASSMLVPAVNSVLCSTSTTEQLTAEQRAAAQKRLGIGRPIYDAYITTRGAMLVDLGAEYTGITVLQIVDYHVDSCNYPLLYVADSAGNNISSTYIVQSTVATNGVVYLNHVVAFGGAVQSMGRNGTETTARNATIPTNAIRFLSITASPAMDAGYRIRIYGTQQEG